MHHFTDDKRTDSGYTDGIGCFLDRLAGHQITVDDKLFCLIDFLPVCR